MIMFYDHMSRRSNITFRKTHFMDILFKFLLLNLKNFRKNLIESFDKILVDFNINALEQHPQLLQLSYNYVHVFVSKQVMQDMDVHNFVITTHCSDIYVDFLTLQRKTM